MKKIIFILILIASFIFVQTEATETKSTEIQVFEDDFESGVDNWDLNSGWSVILEDGNQDT